MLKKNLSKLIDLILLTHRYRSDKNNFKDLENENNNNNNQYKNETKIEKTPLSNK